MGMNAEMVYIQCNVEFLVYCTCRFAYVEFTEKESVTKAIELDDSLFKGRQIKVNPHALCSVHCVYKDHSDLLAIYMNVTGGFSVFSAGSSQENQSSWD